MSDKSTEERLQEVEEENEAIKDYLARLVENGPSRRQVLKGGAKAAGVGMLGFSAGQATADASTSDSDGNVGLPSDRVDVFGDGGDFISVSTNAINTDEIWSSWGTIYPATDSGVDSAISDLNAQSTSGAWIRVPPGFFTVETAFVADNHKAIIGWDASRDKTQIEAGSGHSGPMVDIRGTHYLRDIRFDAKSNVQVATDDGATSGDDAAFVSYINANLAGTSVFPEYEITNVNAFRWAWFNSEVRNGFRFEGSFQNDFFACTFLAPGASGEYAIHLPGTNQARFWGGNVKTGGSDDSAIFVDNSPGRVQAVEFRGVDVEWFSDGTISAPAYRLGASGASNNIHCKVEGGHLRNTNSTEDGTAVVVNGIQGGRVRPTSIDYATTGIDVNTGESKFQAGLFGPFNAYFVTNGYSGFSTNPAPQDMRLVGGSFTTS